MYIPYARLLQDSLIAWSVYGGAALVLVVAVSVAVSERRERRRLERALATARQLPPLRTDPPAPPRSHLRLWAFPALAILLGLIVTAWSAWNAFAR